MSYCKEFAKAGFNIVLMARDEEKLERVASELREEFKIETKNIKYDFSKLSTEESANDLKKLLDQ